MAKSGATAVVVDADAAFGLMFELLKVRPWLVKPSALPPEDPAAQAKAREFLLAAKDADGWGACSPAAQRAAAWFVFEFMAYLRQPGAARGRSWQVPAHLEEWQQALHLLALEIGQRSPRPGSRH